MSRGCGSRQEDAYYLESDQPGEGGSIWAWVWLLGDPENLPLLDVPARLILPRNIGATIMLAEHIDLSPKFFPDDSERALYNQICASTRDVGLVDHVGKSFYTAYSFAEEVNRMGPSRRTTKETALMVRQMIALYGPIPILFTHSRVPVFHDDAHIEEFIALISACFLEEDDVPDWSTVARRPLWLDPDWGLYKKHLDQHNGHNHIGRYILEAVDIVEGGLSAERAERPEWIAVAEFVRDLVCAEQMFGLSYLHKVTYTLPAENKEAAGAKARAEIPGISIVDLNKEPDIESVRIVDEEE
jgi:hypothetical protein